MSVISIIIPVYNCENYLSKCLNSVINQTFKDIEIICINDGSTDNSLEILKQYAQKDSRIIIISQENRKQGAARNRGLDIAKGNYITFVDSDDWVDSDYCEKLLKAAEQFDVNIAAASMIREKKNRQRIHLKLLSQKTFYGANNIISAIDEHLETAGKLYKFECIKDLRFMEEILYEDAPYTIRAINQCNSLVTVPDTSYHYFSNPKSTIKTKQDEKRRNDIIETQLNLLKYAKDNNIILSNNFVVKDEHFPFKVKHYTDRKEYYFCGLKYFTKYVPFNNNRIFVVIQLAGFGDALLCNSLFQNIKAIYPNSKTVFIVNKPYEEAARYQKDVDEVFLFEKRGKNKGLLGILKFIFKFPYKNIDYIFQLHNTARVNLISHLLKPRKLYKIPDITELTIQERNANLLENITHRKINNYPIKYIVDSELPQKYLSIFQNDEQCIALCTTSSLLTKDMPLETAINLIKELNINNYRVILVGSGKKAKDYAKNLTDKNCNVIDLVDKTTIYELAQILKTCEALISVDTGTMHFGYANNVPTICLFYKNENIQCWAPNKNLYKFTITTKSANAIDIFNEFCELKKTAINTEERTLCEKI